jgi:uncharacterized protein (DUF342 family)
MQTTSRFSIHLSSDGLSALISIVRGSAANTAELDAEILKCEIVSGIVSETYTRLSSALADPDFHCENELLALGRAAQPGEEAWLELAFSQGLQPGHVREDSSVDYHDREMLKSIGRGEVLGVVHPAVPGIAGQTIDGRIIPAAAVQKMAVRFLSGIELTPDLTLRAARDGVILYKPGQSLDVVDHFVHQGPVDLHSGNLQMQGSLVIKGDVTRPFSVAATGDVEVLGNVASGSVRAGGRLSIRGGVRGGEGSAVYADGDMTIHHAETAELHSGGLLTLQESVNSRLFAAKVYASGRLRGGSTVAECQIIAKEAGAASGTDTRLTVGEPLERPVSEAQRIITIQKAERMAARAGGRSNDRSKGGKMGRARAELDSIDVQRLAERARRRASLLESATVEVNLAHPGVSIHIGEAQLTLNEAAKFTRYSLDQDNASLRSERFAR